MNNTELRIAGSEDFIEWSFFINVSDGKENFYYLGLFENYASCYLSDEIWKKILLYFFGISEYKISSRPGHYSIRYRTFYITSEQFQFMRLKIPEADRSHISTLKCPKYLTV